MEKAWKVLYEAARLALNARRISDYVTAGEVSAAILSKSGKIYTGVCIDTCHMFDSGYDIVNDYTNVKKLLDEVIGIEHIKVIHLNDSKNPFKSHKDRHEKIGEGSLGLEAITRIINHPKLRNVPFFLETPNELDGYAKEIELLKGVYLEENN